MKKTLKVTLSVILVMTTLVVGVKIIKKQAKIDPPIGRGNGIQLLIDPPIGLVK